MVDPNVCMLILISLSTYYTSVTVCRVTSKVPVSDFELLPVAAPPSLTSDPCEFEVAFEPWIVGNMNVNTVQVLYIVEHMYHYYMYTNEPSFLCRLQVISPSLYQRSHDLQDCQVTLHHLYLIR